MKKNLVSPGFLLLIFTIAFNHLMFAQAGGSVSISAPSGGTVYNVYPGECANVSVTVSYNVNPYYSYEIEIRYKGTDGTWQSCGSYPYAIETIYEPDANNHSGTRTRTLTIPIHPYNNDWRIEVSLFAYTTTQCLPGHSPDANGRCQIQQTVTTLISVKEAPKANITAQNNFPGGSINVGVNQVATSKTSPYSIAPFEGQTVNLSAVEQSSGGYYRLWNDTEAPNNKSGWDKIKDGVRTPKSPSQSYSFTASSSDNNSTYEAGLRKMCNITFTNSSGS